MLGCFNPNLGQIWTNPNVGLKMTFQNFNFYFQRYFFYCILTQHLCLSIFDPNLGWNNPAFFLEHIFLNMCLVFLMKIALCCFFYNKIILFYETPEPFFTRRLEMAHVSPEIPHNKYECKWVSCLEMNVECITKHILFCESLMRNVWGPLLQTLISCWNQAQFETVRWSLVKVDTCKIKSEKQETVAKPPFKLHLIVLPSSRNNWDCIVVVR